MKVARHGMKAISASFSLILIANLPSLSTAEEGAASAVLLRNLDAQNAEEVPLERTRRSSEQGDLNFSANLVPIPVSDTQAFAWIDSAWEMAAESEGVPWGQYQEIFSSLHEEPLKTATYCTREILYAAQAPRIPPVRTAIVNACHAAMSVFRDGEEWTDYDDMAECFFEIGRHRLQIRAPLTLENGNDLTAQCGNDIGVYR